MIATRFKTFKVGPKNQKLLDSGAMPGMPDNSGYDVLIETDVHITTLMELGHIAISPEDQQIAADILTYPNEGKVERRLELFEFPKRADYGRDGVDEGFVRERLQHFGYRPGTLVELLCFGRHIRALHENDWFEARNIIALGSVATSRQPVRKATWFSREVIGTYRHYPELICVAGRPLDEVKLSTTEVDSDGNWNNDILFLAAPIYSLH